MPSLVLSATECQQPGVSSISPRAYQVVTEDLLTERLNLLREELRSEFDDKIERMFELNACVPTESPIAASSWQILLAEDEVEDPIAASLPKYEAESKDLLDIVPTFEDEQTDTTNADGTEVDGNAILTKTVDLPPDASTRESTQTISITKSSRKFSTRDVDDMQVEEAHLDTLEPTVWESAIFIGLPQLGCGGAILLFLLLIVNIVIQVIISIIIEKKFPSDPIEIEGMDRWRHVLGHHHSQVDMFGHSLVSRVCQGVSTLTVAQGQHELIESARTYVGVDYDGPLLCILVILIWFLIWLQEAERIGTVVKEVWLVPTASQTRVAVRDDRWSLENLQRGRKIFMYIVCFVRLIVACLLLVRGTMWLLYTISVTELVLNAVALEFIFDIDELVYDIFTPKVAKAMLERLDIHRHAEHIKGEKVHKKSLAALAHLIMVFTVTTVVFFVYVHPNAVHVRDVIRTSCGGRKNFAIGRHHDLGMLFWARTISSKKKDEADEIDVRVIRELVSHTNNVSSAQKIDDFAAMGNLMSKDASEVADDILPSCHDIAPSELPAFWQTMRVKLNVSELTSCEDVQPFCGHASVHLVRMLCPATCRCYYSRPSTAISLGCPYWKCQDNAATAGYYDETLSCADDEVSSLTGNKHWKSYWQSLLAVKREESRKSASDFEKVVDFALKYGCAVLDEYDLTHDLCSEVKNRHSLGTYCPTACQCPDNDYWGCPTHCYEG